MARGRHRRVRATCQEDAAAFEKRIRNALSGIQKDRSISYAIISQTSKLNYINSQRIVRVATVAAASNSEEEEFYFEEEEFY